MWSVIRFNALIYLNTIFRIENDIISFSEASFCAAMINHKIIGFIKHGPNATVRVFNITRSIVRIVYQIQISSSLLFGEILITRLSKEFAVFMRLMCGVYRNAI